jgi:hypothetical protein
MTQVNFSSYKMEEIINKHFPSATATQVRSAAAVVAKVGKVYTTDTGVIAIVAILNNNTFALLLKPEEFARGNLAAVTFYRDTDGSVLRRIARGQWA